MAQENGHHDLMLGEEVASSTPHASRRPTSRAAARAAPSCGAGLCGPIGARTEWAAHGSQGVAPQPSW
jgi:hypothetical protein